MGHILAQTPPTHVTSIPLRSSSPSPLAPYHPFFPLALFSSLSATLTPTSQAYSSSRGGKAGGNKSKKFELTEEQKQEIREAFDLFGTCPERKGEREGRGGR